MDHDIGYQFKKIEEKNKVHADADLKCHDLTLTQTRVLVFLMDMGGQATQKEIEDDLQVAHPTVVGLVSRMEQKGFLTSCVDPMNLRNKLVTMTEKAWEVGREIELTIQRHDEDLLRGFTEQEREMLENFLDRIIQNLDR